MPLMVTKRDIDVAEILKSRIIKFIVGDDEVEYNVHEAAISGLSGPLRALVTNGMKESMEALRRGPDRFVEMPKRADLDPVDFHVFHFHSEDYLMAHARLYCLADQYAITQLAWLCVEKLQQVLYEHPTTESFNESICKLLLFVWPKTLPEDELRSLLIDFLLMNLSNALTRNAKRFGHVLDEIPEIAVAILRSAPRNY
ncbi:hypothetical protein CCUS01_02480 [Colletotrichum cuscutae]|uniref:BTB domain-containing protein n=1 Tax=Colletotrichum cuscutae TaxID=1209917 RepID=A0AAI9XEX5_9PEZI|nr:hypothetical protein CCUS01_02480 [Colletotrichum cuscutae]